MGKRPDETDVSGVTVTNCTLTGTTNGARIKTYHDSPTLQASGIIFEDLIMNEVANPIIIDQHYNSKKNPKVNFLCLCNFNHFYAINKDIEKLVSFLSVQIYLA